MFNIYINGSLVWPKRERQKHVIQAWIANDGLLLLCCWMSHDWVSFHLVVHIQILICTKLGQFQGLKFLMVQYKNMLFLLLHRPYKFLCIAFIILLLVPLGWCVIQQNWFLKSTFFEVTTLTPNNSKNIRARKKVGEIICLAAFFLFNGVFCCSLLLTIYGCWRA